MVIPGTVVNGDLWLRSHEFEVVKHDVATLTSAIARLADDYKLAGCQTIQEFDWAGTEAEAREAEARDALCDIEGDYEAETYEEDDGRPAPATEVTRGRRF